MAAPITLCPVPPLLFHATASAEKLKAALEVKEAIEVVFSNDYAAFLAALFKAFASVLRTVPPQLSNTDEHKLRNTVLEILGKLPQNDSIKSYVQVGRPTQRLNPHRSHRSCCQARKDGLSQIWLGCKILH